MTGCRPSGLCAGRRQGHRCVAGAAGRQPHRLLLRRAARVERVPRVLLRPRHPGRAQRDARPVALDPQPGAVVVQGAQHLRQLLLFVLGLQQGIRAVCATGHPEWPHAGGGGLHLRVPRPHLRQQAGRAAAGHARAAGAAAAPQAHHHRRPGAAAMLESAWRACRRVHACMKLCRVSRG